MRHLGVALAIAASLAIPASSSIAQPVDPSLLVGSWRVTAIYDRFSDGTVRNTWGSHPQGLIQFTSNGIFSAQLMAGDRAPKPGTVPSDPVGPALSYYGTYTLDNRSFTVQIQQCTWPHWNGTSAKRTIDELTPTSLKVIAAPVTDPQKGQFIPHLEFERLK